MLQASAQGAAASCSGGDDSTLCGTDWSTGDYDDESGLGQDLSALEVLLANIPAQRVGTQGEAAPEAGSSSSGSSNSSSESSSESSDDGTDPAGTGGAAAQNASIFAMLAALGFAVAYCL